jgi:hypothetical protein
MQRYARIRSARTYQESKDPLYVLEGFMKTPSCSFDAVARRLVLVATYVALMCIA